MQSFPEQSFEDIQMLLIKEQFKCLKDVLYDVFDAAGVDDLDDYINRAINDELLDSPTFHDNIIHLADLYIAYQAVQDLYPKDRKEKMR